MKSIWIKGLHWKSYHSIHLGLKFLFSVIFRIIFEVTLDTVPFLWYKKWLVHPIMSNLQGLQGIIGFQQIGIFGWGWTSWMWLSPHFCLLSCLSSVKLLLCHQFAWEDCMMPSSDADIVGFPQLGWKQHKSICKNVPSHFWRAFYVNLWGTRLWD